MNRRLVTLIIYVVATILPTVAQELNCKVTVDYSQVQGTATSVFKSLESAISDYINTRKWTDTNISSNEKIDCNLFITIKGYNEPTMSGDFQIQSSRPVYNSGYTTTLINYKDNKIEFDYREGEPLVFSETTFENNLTALLNFYAYLVLGIDFDSFALQGGEPYYRKAWQTVQMAQSAGESGWRAYDDNRNRGALLALFTEPTTACFRNLIYNYHRKGLDEMSVNAAKGRAAITASLDDLQKLYEVAPMSVGLALFRDSKLDELVNIYTRGQQEERNRASRLLGNIYPTENDRLDMIKRGVNK
jgi:hypothetical protein